MGRPELAHAGGRRSAAPRGAPTRRPPDPKPPPVTGGAAVAPGLRQPPAG